MRYTADGGAAKGMESLHLRTYKDIFISPSKMELELTLRALADPTRLRIMRLLADMELAVGELAQVLGQSQPRVSRHIRILCDAGLAERRRPSPARQSGTAPPSPQPTRAGR